MPEWDWRILRERAALNSSTLAGCKLLVIQHVFDDLYHQIEAIISLGSDPADITIIGIPYSSRERVASQLRGLNCRVVLPSVYPFDGIVTRCVLEIAIECVAEDKRFVIIEDGGYAVQVISQLIAEDTISANLVMGAVEQTSRGTWLDRRIHASGHLPFPVIEITSCKTKLIAEPPYIANAVRSNIHSLLDSAGLDSAGIKTVGIYGGGGTIGYRLAKQFRDDGDSVFISEISPDRSFLPLIRGDFDEITPENLRECDLIIGCSGSTSIGLPVFTGLQNGAIIASASSRQVELDMDWLYGNSLASNPMGSVGDAVLGVTAASQFSFAVVGESKSVTVLYDGYPVNFWGSSLPDYVGDAILALLMEGALAISSGTLEAPGVLPGETIMREADGAIFKLLERYKPDDGIEF